MREKYFAHSGKDGCPPQDYVEHVRGVTELSLYFASQIKPYCRKDADRLENVLRLAAPYHDLGKLDEKNQEVLAETSEKKRKLPVNHVDAGAALLKQKNFEAFLALNLVYGHHRGLCDFTEEAIRRGEECYRDSRKTERDYVDQELERLLSVHKSLIPEESIHEMEQCEGDLAMYLRMLMSCLADADHSNTAAYYGQYPETEKIPELQPERRLEALNQYVDSLDGGCYGERNELRKQMCRSCRDCEESAGIISNEGPVGSGKTTAIMAYQLKQAVLRGARRIFVVLPYTNIIEQSVEVYRKALVLPGEDPEAVVAELHCRADFTETSTRYLTALWRAPVIVTTAAAFFETLASNRPAALRRLHELPGSIIFLDEAHAALPLKLIPLAWRWMRILEEEWGCSWILASGSLVRFWEIPKLVRGGNREVPEMVDQNLLKKLRLYEKNRVQFCWDPRPKSREELTDWVMAQEGPRLLIMNTVQSAAVIAEDIRKKYGRERVEHISNALTSEDRAKTIEVVKQRLSKTEDRDWVLVATSCVEAGWIFPSAVAFGKWPPSWHCYSQPAEKIETDFIRMQRCGALSCRMIPC